MTDNGNGRGLYDVMRRDAELKQLQKQFAAECADSHGVGLGEMLRSMPEWSDYEPSDFDRQMQQTVDGARRERTRADIVRDLDLPITDDDERRLSEGDVLTTRALSTARQWLGSDVPFLALCGSPGVGKTFAAAWALVERKGGSYITARDAERDSTSRYGKDADRWSRTLSSPALLVVDEVGRERNADHVSEALCELLDNRRKRGRRTIFITNLSRSKLFERYPDPRLASRLNAAGACMWLSERGEDLR